jgi:iron complex outermembrane receptor protein
VLASSKYSRLRLERLLLLAILLGASIVNAQTSFTFSGLILDTKDDQPLIGAQVQTSDGKGTAANIEGKFSLDLIAGTHNITVSMIGYTAEQVSITLNDDISKTFRLNPKMELLNQVVISAGRYEQNVAEVTVSMEVLKPELLRNRNLTSLDDALRETPGMIIVDGEPQIRSGSGYSFGAGSRVQILMDGIPQLSGDVGRPTWANIPMEVVEQIEVIKGASSVLYGSAALSGVVHVRSTYPKGEPITRIEAYGGTYAKPRSSGNSYWSSPNIISGRSIMHASQIGNSDLVIGIDLLSDDGHLGPLQDSLGDILPSGDATTADHYNAERRARGWLKYRYRNQKVKGLVYGLSLNAQKNASIAALLWDNTETGLYSAFAGSATETRQTVSNINPFVEYRSERGESIIYRGNWNSLNNNNDNDQGNFSDTYFNEIQFQLDGSRFGVDGLKLISGISTTFAKSDSEIFNNAGLDSKHKSSNLGAYLQADIKLSERLNASAGMRWERFEVDGDSESKPVLRAGLNYKASKATYLRASFGQGYRFPTIGERFISTQVGVINIYPNPDLTSETSLNIEVGVKQGFAIGGFKGYTDLAFFHQEFNNFIEFTFGLWADEIDPLNFFGLGFTSLNTGTATVDGVEFSVAAQGDLGKRTRLSLLGGYTYTLPVSTSPEEIYASRDISNPNFAEFTEVTYQSTSSNPSGDILKYRMQHIARINTDLQYSRFNIGAGLRYNSFMQNIDAVFVDLDTGDFLGQEGLRLLPTGLSKWREENNGGTIIFDMRLGYKFYNDHRVSLIIDNLGNKEYSIRPLVLESTRRVLLKFTFEF